MQNTLARITPTLTAYLTYIVAAMFCSTFAHGTPEHITITVKKLPPSKITELYIAGDFNQWDAGDEAYKFAPNPDGSQTLSIKVNEKHKTFLFKFTRGNWNTEEVDTQGDALDNRRFTYDPKIKHYEYSVDQWKDNISPLPTERSTLFGSLDIHNDFLIPQLDNRRRTVRVLLPHNYLQSKRQHFPVLYMFDGQNAFDRQTASYGKEWMLDEILKTQQDAGVHSGVIVVGIDASAKSPCERRSEYSPWSWSGSGCGNIPGRGDDTTQFIITTLKPFIDQKYRTKTGRNDTSVGGSSMGGLVALYSILQYPEVFSSSFSLSIAAIKEHGGETLVDYINQLSPRNNTRVYVDIGDKEGMQGVEDSGKIVADTEAVFRALEKKVTPQKKLTTLVIPGGYHSELSWQTRIGAILQSIYER